ncbi:uncharacterized protein BDV14DRAFT_171107 [Aspergillus stella-maris]|uniref:uncharacterized protein n=1 Tax=Aspergillus stella-maris TaxID=1810926 RepID=UPI003CCCCA38
MFEVDFVIPDEDIEAAATAMVDNGYQLCTDTDCIELEGEPRDCEGRLRPRWTWWETYHAIPAAHFHLGDTSPEGTGILLSFLKKSEILFWLPEYGCHRPALDDPHLMLTGDSRLPAFESDGSGPLGFGPLGPMSEDKVHPMMILNRAACIESIIYLIARDLANPLSEPELRKWLAHRNVGETMVMGMEDCPYFLEYQRNPRPRFALAWDDLVAPNWKEYNFIVPLVLLRQHLLEVGGLPQHLVRWDYSSLPGWDQVKKITDAMEPISKSSLPGRVSSTL